MLRTINYCFQNNVIASFFCDGIENQIQLVGYIEKFNESELLIAHISPHGYYDGFVLKRVEEVRRINYDGEYEKKIEKLYRLKKQSHETVSTFNPDEDEILYSLLDFAKHREYVISIELQDDCISGFVNGYSDDVVYLSVINDFGTDNGIAIVEVDEIITVSVDTDNEQDLSVLQGQGQ